MAKRSITTEFTNEDAGIETSLRPQYLREYIGQEKVKSNLKVYIEAAKERGDSLDHVLLYGPPGLGKTTLAGIVANEMGTNLKITAGPAIEKPGEMAAILNNLQDGDVLFVDEIHRLNRQVEEVLYPAMEDFVIDIVIGKGAAARSIRLDLPKFTLIGATTRAGMLSAPLRDRFGVVSRLAFYTVEELQEIILHSAKILEVEIDKDGALELARRSRGTPRLANRLLKRVRDFAQIKYDGRITKEGVRCAEKQRHTLVHLGPVQQVVAQHGCVAFGIGNAFALPHRRKYFTDDGVGVRAGNADRGNAALARWGRQRADGCMQFHVGAPFFMGIL